MKVKTQDIKKKIVKMLKEHNPELVTKPNDSVVSSDEDESFDSDEEVRTL